MNMMPTPAHIEQRPKYKMAGNKPEVVVSHLQDETETRLLTAIPMFTGPPNFDAFTANIERRRKYKMVADKPEVLASNEGHTQKHITRLRNKV